MKGSQLIAVAAVSLAGLVAAPAQARCKHEQMPVVLDAIVVTPEKDDVPAADQMASSGGAALSTPSMHASSAPLLHSRPSLINFFRRLFN